MSDRKRFLVLNVDDNEPGRYAKTRALLQPGDIDVIEAATGTEALRLVRERRPTLVLLDVKLPDISGLEVCRIIKRDHPDIFVLQISASFVTGGDRTRGLDAGADSYLTQPVEPNELVASVRALLRIRQAEAQLRESEERLRLVVDSATDYAIITVDADGRIASWSAGAQAILGWTAAEAIGQRTDMIFTPEDRAAGAPEAELRTAIDEGCSRNERWHLRRDGGIVFMNGSVHPLFDAAGVHRGYLKVARDETERRRVTEALAESKAQLVTLVEHLPVGINFVDKDGNTLLTNPAFRVFLPEGILPSKLPDAEERWIGHDEHGQRLTCDRFPGARALRGETVPGTELLHRAPDGTETWTRMSAVPLRDTSGQITGAVGVIIDINAQKRAQEELARLNETLEQQVEERTADLMKAEAALRQAQKMEAVGQLTGGIAHDFNNLLQAMQGGLDLIRRNANDPERVVRFAEASLEALERGAKLTSRLLAFSRVQKLALGPVDVGTLVAGMGNLLRQSAGPLGDVRVEVAENLPTAVADANQLETALLNLVINARDAMPNGGKLTVKARPVSHAVGEPDLAAGEYLEVSVTDTGIGMTPEVAARACEPFFTTKTVGRGTGLGLSQVYAFARQAGGTVRIDSTPGAGSTIRILLPVARTDGKPAAPSTARIEPDTGRQAAGSGNRATVLVVDDDADVRQSLAGMLETLGHRTLQAASGAAALELLGREHPDALVVDFAMPGLNGAETAKAARSLQTGLPVVFVTGYSDTAALKASAPDAPVLRKPFRLPDIEAALSVVLDRNAGNAHRTNR
ncbi:MAG TPA: response regulator [Azospirillaceae bacterium]|nr:response regulator [Azospirillaceae bacterium]